MKRAFRTFPTAAAMARFAAGLLRRELLRGGRRRVVALPGGSTPRPLLRGLAGLTLPWFRAVFFMTDERLVPFSSADSNFGAARRLFFAPAGVPAASLRPPRRAKAYAAALRRAGGLDLAFLGVGEDGHTASLFPGSPALRSRSLAAETRAPRGLPGPRRLTLTPKALNSAGTLVFMAAGPGKKKIFRKAAAGDVSIPAGALRPAKAWFLFARKA